MSLTLPAAAVADALIDRPSLAGALAEHWPEYLMEAGGLGLFMVSACGFATLLGHPASPVLRAIPDPLHRQMLMGLAMGLTAIGIIYSPWGKRSGAHLNPSVTLTFLSLGKVERRDALFYAAFQFLGGAAGVVLASMLLGGLVAHPPVNYAVTAPGPAGVAAAFVAEVAISFFLMLTVLVVSNSKRLGRYTGLFAGALVATYIAVEAPISGMSMNPARTLGSALLARDFTALWIYFVAPPLGMLAAAQSYTRWRGARAVFCAKLHHHNNQRCIFRCNWGELGAQ